MGCAPHHLASQGAGCRSCLKRQFGKKSPQGEALTKAKITLFAEENFVSKILCRQEGKPQHKEKLKFILSRRLCRHSTCRDCLKTAIRQGFPKGESKKAIIYFLSARALQCLMVLISRGSYGCRFLRYNSCCHFVKSKSTSGLLSACFQRASHGSVVYVFPCTKPQQ